MPYLVGVYFKVVCSLKRLDCAESAVFLKMNNHCDMGNTYLCLGWCFMGVLRLFHKYFEGALRSFH